MSEKQLVSLPSRSGHSQRSFCASVAPTARSSLLPESGGLVAEDVRRGSGAAEDLVHKGELDLAEALAAQVGVEVCGPQAAVLDPLLERLGDGLPVGRAHPLPDEVEGFDLLHDEGADPVQLSCEVGIGAEIPGHGFLPGSWRTAVPGERNPTS
ncbi:hypothetical protein ACU686_29375 [Yinghuangia aomiensis]